VLEKQGLDDEGLTLAVVDMPSGTSWLEGNISPRRFSTPRPVESYASEKREFSWPPSNMERLGTLDSQAGNLLLDCVHDSRYVKRGIQGFACLSQQPRPVFHLESFSALLGRRCRRAADQDSGFVTEFLGSIVQVDVIYRLPPGKIGARVRHHGLCQASTLPPAFGRHLHAESSGRNERIWAFRQQGVRE